MKLSGGTRRPPSSRAQQQFDVQALLRAFAQRHDGLGIEAEAVFLQRQVDALDQVISPKRIDSSTSS